MVHRASYRWLAGGAIQLGLRLMRMLFLRANPVAVPARPTEHNNRPDYFVRSTSTQIPVPVTPRYKAQISISPPYIAIALCPYPPNGVPAGETADKGTVSGTVTDGVAPSALPVILASP